VVPLVYRESLFRYKTLKLYILTYVASQRTFQSLYNGGYKKMSSLAATTSAVYCSVCEAIANIYKSFLISRQNQVNRHVEKLTKEYRYVEKN
jgi:hypothetical protein